MSRRSILVVALGASAVLHGACAVSTPLAQSADAVKLDLTRDDFEILGPSEGETWQLQLFWFGVGPPNSFLRAESDAIQARGADLLIGRLRLRTFEGLVLPGFLFGTGDVPIIGIERYRTQGTAVLLPVWARSRFRFRGEGSSP